MSWYEQADTVANVVSSIALVVSIGSAKLAASANKTSKIVAKREIGRDAAPLIESLSASLDYMYDNCAHRDYEGLQRDAYALDSAVEGLLAIYVDYPKITSFLKDLHKTATYAADGLRLTYQHRLLGKWAYAAWHEDTCHDGLNSIRLMTKEMNFRIFDRKWLRDSHSQIREFEGGVKDSWAAILNRVE